MGGDERRNGGRREEEWGETRGGMINIKQGSWRPKPELNRDDGEINPN
jgi:hypothetical protein